MPAKDLEARLQTIEDMVNIDRLEKIYGYYLDNRQMGKIIDLFSDKAESVEIGDRGLFKGKAGIKRFFLDYLGRGAKGDISERKPSTMGFHMQHQGVVTVDPGNKTASGRWYLIMIQARPLIPGGSIKSILGHGVYENKFVKENGVWLFKKMQCSIHYRSPIEGGWTEIPNMDIGSQPGRDAEPTFYHPYPHLEILPYHFKHPVTGK